MNSIVLITDFGSDSPYVAEMKGAILSINNDVRIVDGTHSVPPQNVDHGAYVLQKLSFAFPAHTVFVVVVDPGVGTARSILLVENQNRIFVAPDNGILSHLFDKGTVRIVDQTEFWRDTVSSTFHGRDIMGPVAAHLSSGIPMTNVSSPMKEEPYRRELRDPKFESSKIVGEVVFVDSFGNLITNISAKMLGQNIKDLTVEFANHSLPINTTYGEVGAHAPIALVGSNSHLEIAIVNGNASEFFAASVSDTVRVRKTE